MFSAVDGLLFFFFSVELDSLKFLMESRKIVHASLGTDYCLLVQSMRIPKQPSWAKNKGQRESFKSSSVVWKPRVSVCWRKDWLLFMVLGSTKTSSLAFRLYQCIAAVDTSAATACIPVSITDFEWNVNPWFTRWLFYILIFVLETIFVIKTPVKQNGFTGLVT